jgi:hypothetical protein
LYLHLYFYSIAPYISNKDCENYKNMVDGYKNSNRNQIKFLNNESDGSNVNFLNALEKTSSNDQTKNFKTLNNEITKNEASNFQQVLLKRKEEESKVGKLKCKVVIKVRECLIKYK